MVEELVYQGSDGDLVGVLEFGVLQFLMQLCASSEWHFGRWMSMAQIVNRFLACPHFRLNSRAPGPTSAAAGARSSSSSRNRKRKRADKEPTHREEPLREGECVISYEKAFGIIKKILLENSVALNLLGDGNLPCAGAVERLPMLCIKRMSCVELLHALSFPLLRANYVLTSNEYYWCVEEYKWLCATLLGRDVNIHPDWPRPTQVDAAHLSNEHIFVRFGGYWQYAEPSRLNRLVFETKLADCVSSSSSNVDDNLASSGGLSLLPSRKRSRNSMQSDQLRLFPQLNLGTGAPINKALASIPQKKMLKRLSLDQVEKKLGAQYSGMLHFLTRLVSMHLMLKPSRLYNIRTIAEKLNTLFPALNLDSLLIEILKDCMFEDFSEFCGTFACSTCRAKLEDGIYFDQDGTCIAFFQSEMYGDRPELRLTMVNTKPFSEPEQAQCLYGTFESLLGPVSFMFPLASGKNSYALAALRDRLGEGEENGQNLTSHRMSSQLFKFSQKQTGIPSFKDTICLYKSPKK